MLIDEYNPLKNDKLLQILDEKGKVNSKLEPELKEKDLINIYRFMILSRIADEKAFSLQREGRMRTYAPLKGQEAAQIGSAYALQEGDWVFPSYRDMGAMMVRGVPLHLIYLYWIGNEEGSKFPEGVKVFPITVPVGSQIPIGVGLSWAAMMRNDKVVTLIYFGDGATSEGDFHEGMNLAGLFKTPTVFLCENNQWAISLPRSKQTASRTIAQKAVAYGFNGIQVDGNDVLAVFAATNEAVLKARKGDGPMFIEAYTYRIADHTTADDATRYRNQDEVTEWIKKDPIERFKLYLKSKGLLNTALENRVTKEAEQIIETAVKKAEEVPAPAPEDIFKYTYAKMTWRLEEELEELKESLKLFD